MTLAQLHERGLHLHAIVAMAENRVIGRDGGLPWHLPEDLALFKKRTYGHPLIMGRRTFESLPGRRPLPGRRHLVLSRSLPAQAYPGVEILRSIEDLLACEGLEGDLYLIGGAQIFASHLPLCDTLILSRVKGSPAGDTFFPPFESKFRYVKTLDSYPDFQVELHNNRLLE